MISQSFLALAVLAIPTSAAQVFGPEVDLAPVAPFGRAAQFIDYDGDGDLDVLWSSGGANSVILFDTLGDGSFGTGRVLLPRLQSFQQAFLHDFDADGYLDLVVAGAGLTIALGQADLSFAAPIFLVTAGTFFSSLGMADLNGDGRMDLYAPRLGPRLSWYENQGAGTFAPAADVYVGSASDISIADVDDDGDLDFITVQDSAGTCTVHWNSAGATQWTSTVIASGLISSSLLTVGDLDTDGDVDVGIGSTQFGTISWVEQSGPATFAAPVLIATLPGSPTGLAFADPAGHGRLDIVVTQGNGTPQNVMLIRNTGHGAFLPAVSIADLDFVTQPSSIAVGDLDQDGDDDLFTLSLGSSVFLEGAPQGPLEAAAFPISSNDPIDFASADFDRDGSADMVVLQRSRREIVAYLNRDGGRRFQPQIVENGQISGRAVHAADWDHDGTMDVVALNRRGSGDYEVNWYRGDGAGGFDAPRIGLSGTQALTSALFMEPGDMDADGDLDWLITSVVPAGPGIPAVPKFSWLRNDGQGIYNLGLETAAVPAPPTGIEVVDMDDDGDADILAWERLDRLVYWRENLGSGSFAFNQVVVNPTTGSTLRTARAGDLDGDGDMDVAIVLDSGRVYWAKQLSSGAFAAQADIANFSFVYDIRLDDVDGDDDVDVLVGGDNAQSPSSYFLNGGDGLTWTQAALDGAAVGETVELFTVDLDGDSDLDVVKAHGLGQSTRSMRAHFNGRRIGVGFCGPAAANSTGLSASISAEGSFSVASNNLTLRAETMPLVSFGFFLVSLTPGFTPQAGGSQGNLCLGGSVGRLNRPGEVFNTLLSGAATLPLDVTDFPQPLGAVSVNPGDTWYAQCWFRDSAGSQATSNFTNGLRLEFVN